jgi:hypothetical protein
MNLDAIIACSGKARGMVGGGWRCLTDAPFGSLIGCFLTVAVRLRDDHNAIP